MEIRELSATRTAKIFGIGRSTIYYYENLGYIKSHLVRGRRKYWVKARAFYAYSSTRDKKKMKSKMWRIISKFIVDDGV